MICLCTGWCGFHEQRRFNLGDGSVYAFDYLDKVFFPYHMKQVQFDARFVYESKSDIDPYYNHDIPESARSVIYAKNLKHHFGWFASVLMGAQYSLVNNCDMVYLEQDCLVFGLKEALDWAKGKKIVYGFGDVSWCPNWAEHSFFTVSHEYLGTFLSILNGCRIHENNDILPEVSWHSLFKDVASFWPYPYGRKRPIDFNLETPFYAQQLRSNEIKEFQNKLERKLNESTQPT
jgi:hypothetical protein